MSFSAHWFWNVALRGRACVILSALVVATVGIVGCDSGGGMEGTPSPDRVSLAVGDNEAFVVDSTVTVTATVTDAEDRPVEGVTVQWGVERGGGSVAPESTATGTDGTATTEWTLGSTATGTNAQRLDAAVGDDITASEEIDVNPGPLASLTLAAERDTIAVDSTTQVAVEELRDANGNEIPNASEYSFSWTSLTPDTATIAADDPSSTAQVTGEGDGTARIMVSSGAGDEADLRTVEATQGAVADTVTVEVLQHELRGVWLTNVDSNVLDSEDNIEEAMAFLDKYNFNAVFPVVWNQAATTYPSTVMDTLIGQPIDPQYEGRDPLQELIEAAHARDIAVIPWFEYGFAASYSDDGGPILDENPNWAAKDQDGDLLKKNGFEWMNPYNPAVRDFMAGLIMEVVENYDVDGVQGDDRLPAHPVEGGYSEVTKDLYRQEHDGQDPPAEETDSDWMSWRADILNSFGERVYDEVKAHDQDLIVSWSPSIWSFSYNEYLQDWPTWVNQGHTDLIHPQVYRRNVGDYTSALNVQSPESAGWDEQQVIGLYPGILLKLGGYVADAEDLTAMVQANRDQGYQGEIYFFYEGLREFDNYAAEALKESHYEDPAPLPFKRAGN
ncbi:MAG: family 10 glycosylhydrolase [Salinivenus sp.]